MSVRRFAATGLVAVVAAGLLAGCGTKQDSNAGTPGQQPSGQQPQKVTLTYWTHTHPPMVDLNKQLIAEYQKQHTNVTIDYQIIPNNDFGTKMLTSMSTGTGPDVMNMDDSALRASYMPKGMLAEVDPAALGYKSLDDLKSAYVPGAFEGAIGKDGKIYGIPSEFNVTAFIINTDAFKEANLDPNQPPKTWEQVAAMGQKLTTKDRRGFDLLYLHAGWYNNQLGTLLLQTGANFHTPDGKSALDKPESVKALQIWSDMIYKAKVANPKVASREATQPYVDFANGKVAMTMMNPWGLASFKGTPIEGKYKVVPMPQVDPAKPVNPFYAYYWAVNGQSKVKSEAFKFIAYMSSQGGRWLKDVNFIQPKTGWEKQSEAKDVPFFDVWAAEMLHGKFMQSTSPEEKDIIKAAIERAVLNGEDPTKSFTQAKGEVDKTMQ
ncbi:MAG: Carbohydrate transporter substrate-binding protein family [Firmicutes bacterium]|nr:Carbohydrate transporter substrate-binding protein family [Bacillota bacterium]